MYIQSCNFLGLSSWLFMVNPNVFIFLQPVKNFQLNTAPQAHVIKARKGVILFMSCFYFDFT